MQREYFQKNIWFDFLTPPLGRGCVCGQNTCYHVAAKVVSFNLICNMTIFWKSLILAPAVPPKSTPGAQTHPFKLKSCFIWFISIAALPTCKISAKKMTIALVIAKFKYLTFEPLGGVKGGGVKLDTAMLIYSHWVIMVYSEKLLNIIALVKCEDYHTKKLIKVLHYNCLN